MTGMSVLANFHSFRKTLEFFFLAVTSYRSMSKPRNAKNIQTYCLFLSRLTLRDELKFMPS